MRFAKIFFWCVRELWKGLMSKPTKLHYWVLAPVFALYIPIAMYVKTVKRKLKCITYDELFLLSLGYKDDEINPDLR